MIKLAAPFRPQQIHQFVAPHDRENLGSGLLVLGAYVPIGSQAPQRLIRHVQLCDKTKYWGQTKETYSTPAEGTDNCPSLGPKQEESRGTENNLYEYLLLGHSESDF